MLLEVYGPPAICFSAHTLLNLRYDGKIFQTIPIDRKGEFTVPQDVVHREPAWWVRMSSVSYHWRTPIPRILHQTMMHFFIRIQSITKSDAHD